MDLQAKQKDGTVFFHLKNYQKLRMKKKRKEKKKATRDRGERMTHVYDQFSYSGSLSSSRFRCLLIVKQYIIVYNDFTNDKLIMTPGRRNSKR